MTFCQTTYLRASKEMQRHQSNQKHEAGAAKGMRHETLELYGVSTKGTANLMHLFQVCHGCFYFLVFSNASQRFWGERSTEVRSSSCCDSDQAPAPAVRKYNPLQYSEISYWSAFLQSSMILVLNNR